MENVLFRTSYTIYWSPVQSENGGPLFKRYRKLQHNNSRAWHEVQISSEPRALFNHTHPHLWSHSWSCSDFPGLFLHDRGSYPFLPHQEANSDNHPRLPFTSLSLSPDFSFPQVTTNFTPTKAFFQPQFFHMLSCLLSFKMYHLCCLHSKWKLISLYCFPKSAYWNHHWHLWS